MQECALYIYVFTVTNTESCPLKDCDIIIIIINLIVNLMNEYNTINMTMTFDNNGGALILEEYAFKLTVPSGAIQDGVMVEIQVAVSLFGPFIIHNEYHIISGFV